MLGFVVLGLVVVFGVGFVWAMSRYGRRMKDHGALGAPPGPTVLPGWERYTMDDILQADDGTEHRRRAPIERSRRRR